MESAAKGCVKPCAQHCNKQLNPVAVQVADLLALDSSELGLVVLC